MGCATSLVKYLVFIFNVVFALAGIALLVVGILILKHVKSYDEFLGGKFFAPPILLIVVGSIVFLVAFFGCCGAVRESHCMLVTYVVLLLTIFILQVVIAGLAFAYRDDTKDIVSDKLQEFVQNYNQHKDVMDTIQSNLKCCGYTGWENYGPNPIPLSCCIKGVKSCEMGSKDIYGDGCQGALQDFINDQGNIIGGVAIGIAAVEVAGIIFGLCLANSIKNKDRRGR